MIDLSGQTALVTGGSRGIGAACCEALSAAGARVAINYQLEQPRAEALARRLNEKGAVAHAAPGDVARRDEADALVSDTVERYGSLDILVCNAGIWKGAAVEEISDGEWAEMLGTNLSGVFHVIRAAVPFMKERAGGRIVTISSTAGQRGELLHSHYAATKGAIISLTKSLAVELAPFGIRTNCVAPGWVETDMTRDALGGPHARAIVESIPLARVGQPAEVAGAVLFLVSELASYVNGEILNVNGGSVLCG